MVAPIDVVAAARDESDPAREGAAEVGSNMPPTGFSLGHPVSGMLLTVFGYFAMVWRG